MRLLAACLTLTAAAVIAADAPAFSEKDRNYWAFRPVADVVPPRNGHPIDAFIDAKLTEKGLRRAAEADRRTLMRRVYFDLIGLPPTNAQVEAFANDASPDAWEKVVDALLASPRYGERWARHWLDLVRFAESDGFKADVFRPNAWRYRDYVIKSFNADKPYNRFIKEQLAGDELYQSDLDALIATGFLRHTPDEDNQKDVQRQWRLNLEDCTEATGEVFLGLGLRCAKCHDHKYDPVSQQDYFSMQAFFAAMIPVNKLVDPTDKPKAVNWEGKTAEIRTQMDKLLQPEMTKARSGLDTKLPEYVKTILEKPYAQRSPKEKQYTYLVDRQHRKTDAKTMSVMRKKQEWNDLTKKLKQFDEAKPNELEVLAMGDVADKAPPTTYAKGKKSAEPGFLSVLNQPAPTITPITGKSSGRRTALAKWIANPENQLTTRVITNRIWGWHFGEGIVATPNDFGRQGTPPTHPELLDYLAKRFVADGWSFKAMHRLILTSATYKQSPTHAQAAAMTKIDPENRYLWRSDIARLSGDQLRDAMLHVTGELESRADGPSLSGNAHCRSVFVKNIRNVPDLMLKTFDNPTMFECCAKRQVSTTALQSLLLLNNKWSVDRARTLAGKVGNTDATASVQAAYQAVYGRSPNGAELEQALTFLKLPVDDAVAPLDSQRFSANASPALHVRDARPADRLRTSFRMGPDDDIALEANVELRSLYDSGSVRVIGGQMSSTKKPGWSLGVTSWKTSHIPKMLILQIVGETVKGEQGYQVVRSELFLELNKPYFAAVSIDAGPDRDTYVTFWLKRLDDKNAPMQTKTVKSFVRKGFVLEGPLYIGGRDAATGHGWDGLIDVVRVSRRPLSNPDLLAGVNAMKSDAVLGYWTFDSELMQDSSARGNDLTRLDGVSGPAINPRLVDFCHALLNSNEFVYVD
jgi:hypothetical protein